MKKNINGKAKDMQNLQKRLLEKEAELHEMHEAFLESMMRFRDLYEQSPIGVGIHNIEGELLVVNSSYLKMFGMDSYSDMEKTELPVNLKLTPKQTDKIKSGRLIQYESEFNFDRVNFQTRQKGKKVFLYTISPLLRDKNVIGYMTHIQDISERKKFEMSQRLAQLGRLMAEVTHELNNPLTVISGWTEVGILQHKEDKDKKLKEVFNVINGQCALARDIIDRVLKHAKIVNKNSGEFGSINPNPSPLCKPNFNNPFPRRFEKRCISL